jgi:predicted RNA binding protein YcfA (HicA-like mRNA interferase family)
MSALPVLSGRKATRVFEKLGWQIARQRGSHIIMIKEGELPRFPFPITKKLPKALCTLCFAWPGFPWTNLHV